MPRDVRMCAFLVRLGLLAILIVSGVNVALGQASKDARPPVGGVNSLPDALVIYIARGLAGACGQNCSEWIAVEGTVHWDGHKRMIAALDRVTDRKRPVFLGIRGHSNFNVATSIGRIVRERGLEVSVAQTDVDRCSAVSEVDCIALKRKGGPLNASLSSLKTCDNACVLILAGGVRRSVPEPTTVVIGGYQISNRLGLNISDERREGLHARFGEQFKLYLAQMGVDPALGDMIESNYGTPRKTELSRADLLRLRIITSQ
jgi:hypothetical protein